MAAKFDFTDAELILDFANADALTKAVTTIGAWCMNNRDRAVYTPTRSEPLNRVLGNFEKLQLKLRGPARNMAAMMAANAQLFAY